MEIGDTDKKCNQIFRTFSPSKRILSDEKVITSQLENVLTKPEKVHVFSVTQKDGEYIDPTDEGVTLDDYLTIMDREKHLKGYYKSYIERWQQKNEPL